MTPHRDSPSREEIEALRGTAPAEGGVRVPEPLEITPERLRGAHLGGLLRVLGFESRKFDRDGVAWMHPLSGMKIYEEELPALKTDAAVVKLIYDRGQAAGRRAVREEVASALGMKYFVRGQ